MKRVLFWSCFVVGAVLCTGCSKPQEKPSSAMTLDQGIINCATGVCVVTVPFNVRLLTDSLPDPSVVMPESPVSV